MTTDQMKQVIDWSERVRLECHTPKGWRKVDFATVKCSDDFSLYRCRPEHEAELTPNEKTVFIMTANGHKISSIAQHLKRCEGTIDWYKNQACVRLGITGIAAITRYCIKKGWIEA